jgi:hypothetical protein
MVAWHEFGAWYWVHNTLSNAMDNGELLAIAEQTTPLTPVIIPGARGLPSRRRPNLASVFVPAPTTAPVHTSTVETVGAIGGALGLLALPLLMVGLVRRRRQLRRLRADLLELENHHGKLVVAANRTHAAHASLTGFGPGAARYIEHR